MTTLTLTGLHIAPVSDLSDILVLRVRPYQESVETPTGVRRYAGGRDRIIGRPGRSQSIPFTAVNVPRADWLTMSEDLTGTLCLVRDSRGRAVYGLIGGVSGSEWRVDAATLESVSFTVTEITYSEIV